MPTLIVLDTSLSMSVRPPRASGSPSSAAEGDGDDVSDEHQLIHLARHGIDLILEHIELSYKLEHVAMVSYSSQCELMFGFSRDVAEMRQKLFASAIDCLDCTYLMVAMRGLAGLVRDHWGSSVPINVVLVTDGGLGHGTYSLSGFLQAPNEYDTLFPVEFRGRLSVMCLCPHSSTVQKAYEKLIERTGLEGQVFFQEGEFNKSSVEKMFRSLIDLQYRQYVGTLHFGDELSCAVTLCPPPSTFKAPRETDAADATVSEDLDVKGFISLTDVSSPPVMSRHLVLPWTCGNAQSEEDSRTPNLCVALHGALKVNQMCALVQVAREWFGILFTCADTKKKSSLMLALFEPGPEPVPWLGSLPRLGPAFEVMGQSGSEPFPVRSGHKPSYSASPVVWIRHSSLQSDVQKILRHARKLPDKMPHFYKELNRVKRAALCIGFHELLEGLAATFDRECTVLPNSAPVECAIQLNHAAVELRSENALKLDYQITPLTSRFSKS